MFKLVVLCAFLTATVAEPGALLRVPHVFSSNVLTPATTTITRSASSVVHPTPIYYSAPIAYSHYIKKRSVPLTFVTTYKVPASFYATYAAPAYSTSFYRAPIYAPPVLYSAPHYIKKRSASFTLANTYKYIAPTTYAAAPLLSTYSAGLIVRHSPLIATVPFAYSKFIKK